jgi:hypothetical protein
LGPLRRWFRRPGLIRTLRGSRNAVWGNYSATRRNHFRPAFLSTNSGRWEDWFKSLADNFFQPTRAHAWNGLRNLSAETVHGVSCSRRPFIDVGRCFSGSWPTRQREKQIHWILKSAADCTLTTVNTGPSDLITDKFLSVIIDLSSGCIQRIEDSNKLTDRCLLKFKYST